MNPPSHGDEDSPFLALDAKAHAFVAAAVCTEE
jgi:hypothetical protein